jgi:hypothetical protein
LTADQFLETAEVTPRGDDWGPVPLWTFFNPEANLSIDVHGATEVEARAAALLALPAVLARSEIV